MRFRIINVSNTKRCWLLVTLLHIQTDAFPLIAPEIKPSRISSVSNLISAALGDDTNSIADRYAKARKASFNAGNAIPSYELVYGELSVQVLATILDSVGIHQGDVFLDIGSGDGALVLGASLLYANNEHGGNAFEKAVGLEIVPGLVDRSKFHANNLNMILQGTENSDAMECLLQNQSQVQFYCGDVHQSHESKTVSSILSETTLAVCFATTWSAGGAQEGSTSLNGRKLPKLSKALSQLGKGARIVIIDGRLDENDGFSWQGDLKVNCPDTAPFSIASLYHRQ